MAGLKHLHDTFYCKNVECGWHEQAEALMIRIQDESSKTIADLLQKEVNQILETRKATLNEYDAS